jgi:hypothetical protein
MGTNFYWKTDTLTLPTGVQVYVERDDPDIHLGKRLCL